jgi:hypothetical protein
MSEAQTGPIRHRRDEDDLMAEYLLLINTDESVYAQTDIDMTADHDAFRARHADVILGGAGLYGSDTATTVRTDGTGNAVVTDGLFAESKEVMGGYYLIDVPDLDAAIAVAKDVPFYQGGIEIRPVMVRN